MLGVAFIEGCPHIRGGFYEGFHCIVKPAQPCPVGIECYAAIVLIQ